MIRTPFLLALAVAAALLFIACTMALSATMAAPI